MSHAIVMIHSCIPNTVKIANSDGCVKAYPFNDGIWSFHRKEEETIIYSQSQRVMSKSHWRSHFRSHCCHSWFGTIGSVKVVRFCAFLGLFMQSQKSLKDYSSLTRWDSSAATPAISWLLRLVVRELSEGQFNFSRGYFFSFFQKATRTSFLGWNQQRTACLLY